MHITSLLFSTIAAFFFALIIILNKFYLLKFFKPHELVIFRRSIYPLFLIILLFCAPNTYKKLKTMNREIAFQTFLTVVFGLLGVIFLLNVLKHNKTSNSVTIIYPLIIVFSVLISHIFYGESINKVEFGGIVLSLVGILMVGFNKEIIKMF